MRWTEEEVNLRATIALKRAVPSIVSILIHLGYSVVLTGTDTPSSLIIFLTLVTCLLSIVVLRKDREDNKKWAVFAYYEATQSMVMAAGYFVEPNISGLLCMASTSVLATSETSPLYSKHFNLALCMKHVILWVAILSHTYGVEFWPHGILPATWSVLHALLCVDIKKKALDDSFAYLDALRLEEKRLAGLLQSVPDGIVVLSEFKEVIAHNKAFETQLELEGNCSQREFITAIRCLKYATEFKEGELDCFMEDVMKFVQAETGDVINFSPVMRGCRYLEWRGSVMKWDTRKVCVLTVRDFTKWIQLEKRAQRENESKTALLRSVSHELRTPTNAILNLSIDLKSSESFTSQGKSDISMVISATTFLLSLINDLLDFSRILHDSFSLTKSYFVLEETIKECLQLIEPQCRSKKIQLKSRIDSLLPTRAYTDQNRLRQIVLNMLSNALK